MSYEIFEELCKEKGVKPIDVSRATGVSTATLSSWKVGRYTPKQDKLGMIATYFGVSLEYLQGKSPIRDLNKPLWQDADEYEQETDANERPETLPVRILGRVAAGVPMYSEENVEGYTYLEWRRSRQDNIFGLIIAGDSMEPLIHKGSLVIVEATDDVESGEIAIVMVNGDEGTCKRVQKVDNGIVLSSVNSEYGPMFFSIKDIEQLPVRIIGRVIEARTAINGRGW